MKLTKYEHACLIIDNGQSRLIIDPGCFTKLPSNLKHVEQIIVTEEHLDHFDLANLKLILGQSPDAVLYTTKAVTEQLADSGIDSTAIAGAKTVKVHGFMLKFYETDHAPVYKKTPCKVLRTCSESNSLNSNILQQ